MFVYAQASEFLSINSLLLYIIYLLYIIILQVCNKWMDSSSIQRQNKGIDIQCLTFSMLCEVHAEMIVRLISHRLYRFKCIIPEAQSLALMLTCSFTNFVWCKPQTFSLEKFFLSKPLNSSLILSSNHIICFMYFSITILLKNCITYNFCLVM